MRISFWLLDINEQPVDNRPQIFLWGLDKRGRRILIVDKHLFPYFFIIPDEKYSIQNLAERVKATLNYSANVEILTRRLFGSPVNVVKVTAENQNYITKYVGMLHKMPGVRDCLEDDFRLSYRYLVDYGVNPSGWNEVEVEEEEVPPEVRVEAVYRAISKPKALNPMEVPWLRVLAFSMISYSPWGTPKPERSPVALISCATNTGQSRQFISEDLDDQNTINSFISYLNMFDPDIIAGFRSNSFEWPFLLERTKKLGLKLRVARTPSEPHTSVYGHISITGRSNIDFANFTDEISEVKIKTLENIASFLEINEAKEECIDEAEYAAYWDDPLKRSELAKYSMNRAKMILGVAEEMLGFAEELSSISGLPLDQVGSAAVGFRVESYLIHQAYQYGELIPKKAEHQYLPYQGAIVLKPKPGIHEDVAVLDFKAMYPSLMIAYNISPDMYVDPNKNVPEEEVYTAPYVGHRFCKAPPGFYSKVLTKLLETRNQLQNELKNLESGSVKHKLLDSRQKAVKVMTNAVYGYAGWIGARWYFRPVAEATAAWGRYIINETISIAKDLELEVIYGDTDSIFIKYDKYKIEKLLDEVKTKLGLEIRSDMLYKCILFTEAKKRYAGITSDGGLDIVGLEVARGDWPEIARKVQESVLEILLREKSPDKAVSYVKDYIITLHSGKFPYKYFIIWKSLTKALSEYSLNAPHVEAAKHLIKNGWEVTAGDKIGYVIIKGSGKLHERAMPYMFASSKDIDLKYYEEQQVIPSVLRILSLFQVNGKSLTL